MSELNIELKKLFGLLPLFAVTISMFVENGKLKGLIIISGSIIGIIGMGSSPKKNV